MFDDHGQVVSEAMPSTPVEVMGWRETPSAGDEVIQVESEVNSEIIVFKGNLHCCNKLS